VLVSGSMHTTVSLNQGRISLLAHASHSVLYVTRLVSSSWTKSTRVPTNLIAHRDCMREMRRANSHALLVPQRCF
jgi:hypothetical protein